MFSFFKSSKKHSPVESPESSDAAVPTQSDPDDYVLIEQRSRQYPSNNNPYAQSANNVYPMLGGNGNGPPYTVPNGVAGSTGQTIKRQESVAFHYLQGVPFKLSSEIATGGDSTEIMRIQVDEILASLTRRLDFASDYEFTLEQSIS